MILTVWCEDPQERSCVRVQPEEQNHYVLYAHIDTHTHAHTHTRTHTHREFIDLLQVLAYMIGGLAMQV